MARYFAKLTYISISLAYSRHEFSTWANLRNSSPFTLIKPAHAHVGFLILGLNPNTSKKTIITEIPHNRRHTKQLQLSQSCNLLLLIFSRPQMPFIILAGLKCRYNLLLLFLAGWSVKHPSEKSLQKSYKFWLVESLLPEKTKLKSWFFFFLKHPTIVSGWRRRDRIWGPIWDWISYYMYLCSTSVLFKLWAEERLWVQSSPLARACGWPSPTKHGGMEHSLASKLHA